jgi:CRISPR-associated protein Cmr2
MAEYTAISFAPVQGFIEKSRKLRDLYGASQILSYLSYRIVEEAKKLDGIKVISPATKEGELSIDLIQGMPNRILIVGEISHDRAFNLFRDTLNNSWSEIIKACKDWVECTIKNDTNDIYDWKNYDWNMSWKRWEMHAWEIFVGQNNPNDDQNNPIHSAMRDLETRKLRRAWTVPNWNGESSSLSGHDAIVHPNMDRQITRESRQNQQELTEEIKAFYKAIAKKLDPHGNENDRAYINENERLSIPELIKRLVTYPDVRDSIDYYRAIPSGDKKAFEIESFAKLMRKNEEKQETYWTGWFMGDGDRIGNYLNSLSDGESVKNFSSCLRDWGHDFKRDFKLGRVLYAGGDDFLGVIYGTDDKPQMDKQEVVDWLCGLRAQWEKLRENMRNKGLRVNDGNEPDVSLSVGFVWAGHSVPQRDVLQHCREAEKLAKSLGRDRITIRVVFNNGQFVQWTTPWQYLEWLGHYCDRNTPTGEKANWSHVYGDLAQLKARHAIPPANAVKQDEAIALELLKLYFGKDKGDILSRERQTITGDKNGTAKSVIEWIEGMIQIGWYLCSDS